MGDEIVVDAIEIIHGGVFQIDFKNTSNNQYFRSFIDGAEMFKLMGDAMQRSQDVYNAGCDEFGIPKVMG